MEHLEWNKVKMETCPGQSWNWGLIPSSPQRTDQLWNSTLLMSTGGTFPVYKEAGS
jgi:hypothetical protein